MPNLMQTEGAWGGVSAPSPGPARSAVVAELALQHGRPTSSGTVGGEAAGVGLVAAPAHHRERRAGDPPSGPPAPCSPSSIRGRRPRSLSPSSALSLPWSSPSPLSLHFSCCLPSRPSSPGKPSCSLNVGQLLAGDWRKQCSVLHIRHAQSATPQTLTIKLRREVHLASSSHTISNTRKPTHAS